MALRCWVALWAVGALLLPGFPSTDTARCGPGAAGSACPLMRLLTGRLSAAPAGPGATAPEQLTGRLLSDQLGHRRHSVLSRRRRNILFPSGVKLCTQETFDQAAANHLTFFQHRGESPSPPLAFGPKKVVFPPRGVANHTEEL